jgi:transcriptional regulator
MFTPKTFQETDQAVLLDFMRSHAFALLVAEGHLMATHLPYIIDVENDKIKLTSHMALANPQAKMLDGQRVMVIFSGPHAYIAPSLYANKVQVPTWNYVAVHANGTAKLINGHEAQIAVMERTFATFGPAYAEQWTTLPHQYRDTLLEHIQAFEVDVTELQGQFKLSQNKPQTDRQTIIDALEASADAYAQETATYMRRIV